MKEIDRYFPDLDAAVRERFDALEPLYRSWNGKINVISRKDIDNFALHHLLHSLSVAKAVQFAPGERVLDIGTGGGFPGIPLAILFPHTRFTLCDSIGKKIKVASDVASQLALDNVECVNCRVEALPGKFDAAVTRAVADLSDLYGWVKGRYGKSLICLKGGDVESEVERCAARHHLQTDRFEVFDISRWYEEDYFNDKKIVILK